MGEIGSCPISAKIIRANVDVRQMGYPMQTTNQAVKK
jgi:hypothetical protein